MSIKNKPETQSGTDIVEKLIEQVTPKDADGIYCFAAYEAVLHENLRTLFADAQMKYGKQYPNGEMSDCWLDNRIDFHTHTCIAFNFKPLEPPAPTKAEIIEALQNINRRYDMSDEAYDEAYEMLNKLTDRLERHKGSIE